MNIPRHEESPPCLSDRRPPPFRNRRARKGASVLFAAVAASALVLACGSAPAFARQTEPRVEVGPSGVYVDDGVNRVDVNPGGTRVDTPGAHVDVRPGSHVLVCANGVRVVVHAGQAPNCPQPPPAPPAPEPPAPAPPVPEPPARVDPAPPQSREAPPAAPFEPAPVESAPVGPEAGPVP
ncbi:hypothetical protein NE857_30275 [Nocardiopsis exhalans]|uniref:Uncharacterized protein n=1 Tax=Nocardiopsis exhalans TaxID=163604 RepID=A0ABY5D833_9ACTN|nr:hypothetical protein [Nocardiopsis exhalans]USY19479.1 hypothetical protein NE857_30275 [Nocardiopsis exhalans]